MKHALLLFFLTSGELMSLRVPVSKPRDEGQQGGSSTAVRKSLVSLRRSASDKPQEVVPVVSKDALPSQLAKKSQSHQEENRNKQSEAMEAQEVFLGSSLSGGMCIFCGCSGYDLVCV